MEDFREMLAAAHQLGLKLVMDLVVNHTSDEHSWFIESRKAEKNKYRDYYIWREPNEGKEPNNWGSCFSGSAWKYDEQVGMYFLHLFSEKQPDLNWENKEVREEIYDMMNWWLLEGIDGFRMDVISLISKDPAFPDGKAGVNGYASFNEPANGPRVHEYIQEMREKVLSHADILTVGECSGVTLEEAKKYASADGKELSMVFQFEHMDVDADGSNKWSDRKMDLRDLKNVMTKWQNGLHEIAWNSLFWENHDQPRSVSRFGNDKEYREVSAKMLAVCLHMMQGTPYIYQGQELGMTNVPFQNIEDFRDLDSINAFHELVEKGIVTAEEMMEYIRYKGRDNARTPFQWDDSENAGFSSGTPWIMVNPNYCTINAKEQIEREDSVFHFYQKLIRIRKDHDIVVYGKYELLLPENQELYVYTRSLGEEKLLVICNFSENNRDYLLPDSWENARIWIENYKDVTVDSCLKLRPFEAIVLYQKQ